MNSLSFVLTKTLLLFLLVNVGTVFSKETGGIIDHQPISIQTLPRTFFSSWPNTDNKSPVAVRALSERLWFVWSGAVVSLTPDAQADVQTLLSLFSSRTATWGKDSWSPAGGILCTDGIWRGQAEKGTILRTLNLQTGESSFIRTSIPSSAEFYPIPEGRILVRSDRESFILLPNGSKEIIPFSIPPVSMLTSSSEVEYTALFNVQNRNLTISTHTNISNKNVRIEPSQLPSVPPWSITWMGKILVLGYPGRLFLFFIDNSSTKKSLVLEESWIPNRWYQLHGADNRLILHSPEEKSIKLITFGMRKSKISSHSPTPIEYSDVLEKNAVKTGEYLLAKNQPIQTGLYYTWVLAQIRNFRSLQPLSPIWPRLEKEIVDKRAALEKR